MPQTKSSPNVPLFEKVMKFSTQYIHSFHKYIPEPLRSLTVAI